MPRVVMKDSGQETSVRFAVKARLVPDGIMTEYERLAKREELRTEMLATLIQALGDSGALTRQGLESILGHGFEVVEGPSED